MKAAKKKRRPKKAFHRNDEKVEILDLATTNPLVAKVAEGICFGIAVGIAEYFVGEMKKDICIKRQKRKQQGGRSKGRRGGKK